jgi:hypothetical protein
MHRKERGDRKHFCSLQEIVQSAGTTFNKAVVISSNPSSLFYTDMSKKKKKNFCIKIMLKKQKCYPKLEKVVAIALGDSK